jgi:hypothetical protein
VPSKRPLRVLSPVPVHAVVEELPEQSGLVHGAERMPSSTFNLFRERGKVAGHKRGLGHEVSGLESPAEPSKACGKCKWVLANGRRNEICLSETDRAGAVSSSCSSRSRIRESPRAPRRPRVSLCVIVGTTATMPASDARVRAAATMRASSTQCPMRTTSVRAASRATAADPEMGRDSRSSARHSLRHRALARRPPSS